MSWSDETRCLYCDGKLPLYRKLTNGQFCSTPHQKAYWKEQERLAVEVLHRTHDALMAYRPQGDIELIIGPAVGSQARPVGPPPPASAVRQEPIHHEPAPPEPLREEPVPAWMQSSSEPVAEAPSVLYAAPSYDPAPPAWSNQPEPPFADFLKSASPEDAAPKWTMLPLMRAEDPFPLEPVLDPPEHSFLESIAQAPMNQLEIAGTVPVPVEASLIAWTAADVTPLAIRTLVPSPLPSGLELYRPEWTLAPDVRLSSLSVVSPNLSEEMALPPRMALANPVIGEDPVVALEFGNPIVTVAAVLLGAWAETQPVLAYFEVERPVVEEIETELSAGEPFHAETAVDQPAQEEEHWGPIPALAGWCHKPAGFASIECTTPLVERDVVGLEFSFQSPQAPPLQASAAEPFGTALESLQKLPLKVAQFEAHPRPAMLTWFRLGAFNPARLIASSLTPIEPHVRLAGGCRYTMNRASQVLFSSPVEAVTFGTAGRVTAFPALEAKDRQAALQTNFAPNFSPLVDLTSWKSEIPAQALKRDSRPRGVGQILAFPEETWLPALRLQPLKWIASRPLLEIPVEDVAPPAPLPEPAPVKDHQHFGPLLLGFWKNAPRDLRLLMFAIPALLALAFHPSLPKVHVSTVQATEPVEKNVGQAINGSWSQFKQVVSERAAVALDEDFRSGLDDWASPGGNATEWSFDANGFVRPGSLALYSPSLSLADYQAQFLGLIDQKSLSWVVRAADFSNYYVVKLVVRKPGPLTTLGLTRYAVIDGKPQDRVDAVVPFTARPDMLYRVRMDVRDDSFVLAIQGQMVDAWSEPRLKKGGIGFFSARGEGSRVRWLQVTHQYDMLGRLCSYLAPYDQSAAVLPTETTTTTKTSTKNNGSWQR